MRAAPVGLTLSVLVLAGCHVTPVPAGATPEPAATSGAGMAADSLVGLFALEGSEPGVRAVLRISNASVELVDAPRELRGLSRARIVVMGTHLDARRFRVLSFRVVEIGGQLARDGMLCRDAAAGGYHLVLADGSMHALVAMPPGLAELTGHRVWVVESGDGSVASYGIIARPAP